VALIARRRKEEQSQRELAIRRRCIQLRSSMANLPLVKVRIVDYGADQPAMARYRKEGEERAMRLSEQTTCVQVRLMETPPSARSAVPVVKLDKSEAR